MSKPPLHLKHISLWHFPVHHSLSQVVKNEPFTLYQLICILLGLRKPSKVRRKNNFNANPLKPMQITQSVNPPALALPPLSNDTVLFVCGKFQLKELFTLSLTSKAFNYVTGFSNLWKEFCMKAEIKIGTSIPKNLFREALYQYNYKALLACAEHFSENNYTSLQLHKTFGYLDHEYLDKVLAQNSLDVMIDTQLQKANLSINFPKTIKCLLKTCSELLCRIVNTGHASQEHIDNANYALAYLNVFYNSSRLLVSFDDIDRKKLFTQEV